MKKLISESLLYINNYPSFSLKNCIHNFLIYIQIHQFRYRLRFIRINVLQYIHFRTYLPIYNLQPNGIYFSATDSKKNSIHNIRTEFKCNVNFRSDFIAFPNYKRKNEIYEVRELLSITDISISKEF